jgi:hypothetical protein
MISGQQGVAEDGVRREVIWEHSGKEAQEQAAKGFIEQIHLPSCYWP